MGREKMAREFAISGLRESESPGEAFPPTGGCKRFACNLACDVNSRGYFRAGAS